MPNQGLKMRLYILLVVLGAGAFAQRAAAEDCRAIAEPALRLTCYDKLNPPLATYPIPLPKPTHAIPITRPDGTVDYLGGSSAASEDDTMVNAKLHGICRGC
jgi:hypothetical protein